MHKQRLDDEIFKPHLFSTISGASVDLRNESQTCNLCPAPFPRLLPSVHWRFVCLVFFSLKWKPDSLVLLLFLFYSPSSTENVTDHPPQIWRTLQDPAATSRLFQARVVWMEFTPWQESKFLFCVPSLSIVAKSEKCSTGSNFGPKKFASKTRDLQHFQIRDKTA